MEVLESDAVVEMPNECGIYMHNEGGSGDFICDFDEETCEAIKRAGIRLLITKHTKGEFRGTVQIDQI